ncbi:hypothetical protein J3A83DRAFT_4358748 [Scleroderma citrinum]
MLPQSCNTLSKNSPISLANVKQFNPIPQPLHICQHMLQAIQEVVAACDPCNIVTFHKFCLTKHLNGIVEPFWERWGNACPLCFLTPDALHQWHKFYFNHCLQIGTRHWMNSISTLKQCTGCEHHDLEKVLPAVAAGASPDDVLCALQAIMEFTFLAQNLFHYNKTILACKEALCEFHHYKSSILITGGSLRTNGLLNHFQILKVELAQHIVCSIYEMGAPYQWSSDITKCCHIKHVKMPYCLSNC